MKRLGIFSFFDRDGKVGNYIDFLLTDLTSNLDLLVIVVNGVLDSDGYQIFQKYTDRILLRDNVGYDAGAYKDVMMNYLGIETIRDYDQLVLCNDTFYGPFVPFKKIFMEMDELNIDFWGLNYVNDHIATYVESYFLVINRQIIEDGGLFEYFETWIDDRTTKIENIYAYFEVGLFEFLLSKGYCFHTYTNKNCCNIYLSSDFCIKKYRFPIMKKKSFSSQYYRQGNIFGALKYINRYMKYDIELILQEAYRVYKFPFSKEEIINYPDLPSHENKFPLAKVGRQEIEKFLTINHEIYIYGTGIMASHIIAKYISGLHSNFLQHIKGFVVSDNQYIHDTEVFGFRVLHFSEIEQSTASILVALNINNTRLVSNHLDKCRNVLQLWDI